MKNVNHHSVLLILICSISFSYAQKNFSKIDAHADDAPTSLKRSIPALVNYLVHPAQTDLEKVRVIFRWITQNIDYDIQAYNDHRLIVEDPQRVINRGRAVCGGYSELFNRLCKEAGIQSKLIGGWSKGYGERLTGRPNHAWNAVKINFRWYLLDVTWGAGHINSEQKFIRAFNNHYFLTDPEQLIYDHLPEDESWQLIKQTITRKQFDNLILLKPAFFKNGLKLKSHLSSKIVSNGELTVELGAPDDTFLSAQLLTNNTQLPNHHCFTQRRDGSYTIQVRFPENGNYTLRLFVKEGQETVKYNWALDYDVIVKNSSEDNKLFVKQFGKFHDLDAFVYQPLDFLLIAGEVQNFKIELQDAIEVSIFSGDEVFPLKKTANIFEGNVIVPEGLFHLAVRTDTTNYYHWLLEYEGR